MPCGRVSDSAGRGVNRGDSVDDDEHVCGIVSMTDLIARRVDELDHRTSGGDPLTFGNVLFDHLGLEFRVVETQAVVRADPAFLRRLLALLLDNACKWCNSRVSLTIETLGAAEAGAVWTLFVGDSQYTYTATQGDAMEDVAALEQPEIGL